MGAQDNKRLVQEAYAAFGRGDIAAVLDRLTDDIEWYSPGPSELPLAGMRRGREQVAGFFNDLNQAEEILTFDPKEFIAEDDTVVAIVHYRSRVKATGRTAETDLVHIFSVRNGKITRFREFFDTALALNAYQGVFSTQSASGA